jgi:hypothetical protein
VAKSKWVPTDRYAPAANRTQLLSSMVALVGAMVSAPDVVPQHRRYYTTRTLWSLTEFEGKYNVPWGSAQLR